MYAYNDNRKEYDRKNYVSNASYSNSSDGVSSCLGRDASQEDARNRSPQRPAESDAMRLRSLTSTRSDPRAEQGSRKPSNVSAQSSSGMIEIVCISDTHNGQWKTDFGNQMRRYQGDILIHAGDFSDRGSDEEIRQTFSWLRSLDNFRYKIFIAGNMDGIGMDDSRKEVLKKQLTDERYGVYYLQDSACVIEGIKIYGCPYTPKFAGGFQYERESPQAKRIWQNIPHDCDILISHGPPYSILDQTSRSKTETYCR